MRHLLFLISIIIFARAAVSQDIPIAVGEKLEYEAKISRLKFSIAVSDLSFAVHEGPTADQMLIKSRAKSKGTMLKLFRYSFLQEMDSIANFKQSRVFRTTKHDVQKKNRVRDSVAVFDYGERRVSFTETDPNDPRRPPRRIGSVIGSEMHDLITALYSLRGLPMKVGATFEIPASDSGLVYKIPGRITAREQLKTILGKVWCWRVEPFLFGPGRLIEQNGSMVLWITDDKRRVPVRADLNTTYGNIDVKLKAQTRTK